MLLKQHVLDAIKSGEIQFVYRRWAVRRVNPGSKLRTSIGVIEVTTVDHVEPGQLTMHDAISAGFTTLEDLIAPVAGREGDLYRIGLRYHGPDPRVVLRTSIPHGDELEEVKKRLAHLDRGRHGSWTEMTLSLIADNPGVRAENLAQSLGREKRPFKTAVRRLKELGLTESLRVGYRLSPRGRAVLDSLRER